MIECFFLFLNIVNLIHSWPNIWLFNQQNLSNKHEILSPQNITNSSFDFAKKTNILIHGFADDGNSFRLVGIKNQILKSNDVNVIIVDWGKGAAAPNYFSAKDNSKICGQKVGKFIIESKIDPTKVHCIGHSLGAHACGFTGKVIKLNRISGLDPAGPLFNPKDPENRLDKSDANLVDVMHTDWFLGMQESIGHKDFYPNGGKSQPGCNIFGKELPNLSEEDKIKIYINSFISKDSGDIFACSHVRSEYLYQESIGSIRCQFKSTPCSSYENFQAGKCNCDPKYGCSSMGFRADNSLEEGKFYLNTNKTDPYCLS